MPLPSRDCTGRARGRALRRGRTWASPLLLPVLCCGARSRLLLLLWCSPSEQANAEALRLPHGLDAPCPGSCCLRLTCCSCRCLRAQALLHPTAIGHPMCCSPCCQPSPPSCCCCGGGQRLGQACALLTGWPLANDGLQAALPGSPQLRLVGLVRIRGCFRARTGLLLLPVWDAPPMQAPLG